MILNALYGLTSLYDKWGFTFLEHHIIFLLEVKDNSFQFHSVLLNSLQNVYRLRPGLRPNWIKDRSVDSKCSKTSVSVSSSCSNCRLKMLVTSKTSIMKCIKLTLL